ncbi:hypothetical protein K2X33_15190, partial [bacterium]|nr:hypothetical protein [bacterium]
MSLRAKIISSFVVTLVLFASVSFYHFRRTQKAAVRLALVNELYLPLSRHIAQLQSAVQGLAEDVRRYYFGAHPTADDSTLGRMVRDLYPYLIRKNITAAEALLEKASHGSSKEQVPEISAHLAAASKSFDALSGA